MDPEMDRQLKIGFIGAGNMAYGIAKGILTGKSGRNFWDTSETYQGEKFTFYVFPLQGNVAPVNIKVSAPSSRNLGRFQVVTSSSLSGQVGLLDSEQFRITVTVKLSFD